MSSSPSLAVFNPRVIVRTPRHPRGAVAPLPPTFLQLQQLVAELAEIDAQSNTLTLSVDDGLVTGDTYRLVRDGDIVNVSITAATKQPVGNDGNVAVPEKTAAVAAPVTTASSPSRKRPREELKTEDEVLPQASSASITVIARSCRWDVANGPSSASATNQSKSSAYSLSQPVSPRPLQPQSQSSSQPMTASAAPPRSPARASKSPARPSRSPAKPAKSSQPAMKQEPQLAPSRSSTSRPSSGRREQIVIYEDDDNDMAPDTAATATAAMPPASIAANGTTSSTDTSVSASDNAPDTAPSVTRVCATPQCGRPAGFGPCPMCAQFGTPKDFRFFCDNECFRKNWIQHSNLYHRQ